MRAGKTPASTKPHLTCVINTPFPGSPRPQFSDLHLRSGKVQRSLPGGKTGEGHIHAARSGQHGTIRLGSDSLEWSTRSPSLSSSNMSTSAAKTSSERLSSCPRCGSTSPFLRVDADSMEASGFLEGVRLSAARSFDFAVVGGDGATLSADEEESKKGKAAENTENTGVKREEGESEGLESDHRSSLTASGLQAALLRGTENP